ncbi:MAG: hypothetical protein HYX78_11860 [Armatimonadetes bacterium]|nr:hypothetical protein [Armatimonadota bacterium]
MAKTLETVKRICAPAARWGAANARRPDGSVNTEAKHHSKDIFNAENIILAMTMLYAGDRETGMQIAYENMENLILEKGLAWDMPNTVTTDTGDATHGHDFDQMMVLWALPLAMVNQTLADAGAPGGLVDSVMKAASDEQ